MLGGPAAGCRTAATPKPSENPPGRWYVVEPGETLGDVARRAGVPEEDLREVNGIGRSSEVRPGSLVFVLDARGSYGGQEPGGASPAGPAAPALALPRRAAAPGEHARLRWPVGDPRLSSPFGARGGRPHEGIDLHAPTGTPVLAADSGEVIYAGNTLRGYGNMVVLRHAPDLLTVYAHNSVLLVKPGERVASGQRLALSGQSGRATAPHVHFEVRQGEIPRDPLLFLPERSPP